MTTCLHHVPGRLRVRIPNLASVAGYDEQLRGALSALAGVRGVEVNRRAASATVLYDPQQLAPDAILTRIAEMTGAPIHREPPAPGNAPLLRLPQLGTSAAILGGLFGKALFDAMLAKGVERSVRVLVTGLR